PRPPTIPTTSIFQIYSPPTHGPRRRMSTSAGCNAIPRFAEQTRAIAKVRRVSSRGDVIASDIAAHRRYRVRRHHRTSGHVEEHGFGVLEQSDQLVSEGGADVSVDEAMIEAEREKHHVADDDLIASHDGLSLHLVNAEDRNLGEVDDRSGEK